MCVSSNGIKRATRHGQSQRTEKVERSGATQGSCNDDVDVISSFWLTAWARPSWPTAQAMPPTNQLTAQPWTTPGPTCVVSTSEKWPWWTSPLLQSARQHLITNHYSHAVCNRKLDTHLGPANAPHSRIMQPQYLLKVDQIQPSTSQDAPPFTTVACIPICLL